MKLVHLEFVGTNDVIQVCCALVGKGTTGPHGRPLWIQFAQFYSCVMILVILFAVSFSWDHSISSFSLPKLQMKETCTSTWKIILLTCYLPLNIPEQRHSYSTEGETRWAQRKCTSTFYRIYYIIQFNSVNLPILSLLMLRKQVLHRSSPPLCSERGNLKPRSHEKKSASFLFCQVSGTTLRRRPNRAICQLNSLQSRIPRCCPPASL